MHSNCHDHRVLFHKCNEPPNGHLQIVNSVMWPLRKCHNGMVFSHNIYSKESKYDAKRAYDNYIKDCWTQQYCELSYGEYIENIIDKLIDDQDTVLGINKIPDQDDGESPSVENTHIVNSMTCSEYNDTIVSLQVATLEHRSRPTCHADRVHGGRVVPLLPPTSEARVQSP